MNNGILGWKSIWNKDKHIYTDYLIIFFRSILLNNVITYFIIFLNTKAINNTKQVQKYLKS